MKQIKNEFYCKSISILKGAQKYLLFLLFCASIPGGLFGFDFGEVRQSLKNDIVASKENVLKTTIAIVYNNKNREEIKKQINLISFKKELSTELVRSFKVVDPILVERVLEINKITYQSLLKNSDYLKGFSSRSESTHVLFVDMLPQPDRLLANMQLLTSQGQLVSKVHIEIPIGAQPSVSAAPVKETAAKNYGEDNSSILEQIRENFTPSAFVESHNESFIYFTPTAYVQPETHAVDVLTWIKDLKNVEFVWMRLKYDYKFANRFQVGIQANGIAEKRSADEDPNDSKEMGHHSTYATLKYLIADERQLPVAIAAGIKGRLLWDNGNTDFETGDDDLDDKNDSQNKLTLFAAVSGKLENLGLMINFYLDNQQFGTGAKFLLTPDIKVFFDNVFYYYKDAQVDDDQAIGIQIYSPDGTVFTLSHQYEPKQVQLGIGVNW